MNSGLTYDPGVRVGVVGWRSGSHLATLLQSGPQETGVPLATGASRNWGSTPLAPKCDKFMFWAILYGLCPDFNWPLVDGGTVPGLVCMFGPIWSYKKN